MANAKKLARPGQIALDRGAATSPAASPTTPASSSSPPCGRANATGELLNGFALAFIEARQWNEAISVLKYVLRAHDEYAEAHVNLGLAYQMRGLDGDRGRAVDHFERALDLRPDWELVAEHLSALTTAPSAQGPY